MWRRWSRIPIGLLIVASGCSRSSPSAQAPAATAPTASAAPAHRLDANPDAGASPEALNLPMSTPDPSKLLEPIEEPPINATRYPGSTGLVMAVSERGPGLPWTIKIWNAGPDEAELVADMRLLSLEVTAPGKKKSANCQIPDSQLPHRAEPRLVLTLGPGEGVEEHFDPRLYCFAAAGQDLLVPGAIVVPRFGWAELPAKVRWKRGRRVQEPVEQPPPYVATLLPDPDAESKTVEPPAPPGPSNAKREGLATAPIGEKRLVGAPLALRSEYQAWSRARPRTESPENAPLSLRLVQGSDAEAETFATVELVLKNLSKERQRVYFRREFVSFEVKGPPGLVRCDATPDERAPDKQAFLTLGRGERRNIAVRLAELCPRGTFAMPGLYLVHARFDAMFSGEELGIDGFVGTIQGDEPAAVRIRTGEAPLLEKRPMRKSQHDTHTADAGERP